MISRIPLNLVHGYMKYNVHVQKIIADQFYLKKINNNCTLRNLLFKKKILLMIMYRLDFSTCTSFTTTWFFLY